jgi:hypothetical protein
LTITIQVADAPRARAGIVHRDIKAGNVRSRPAR